MERLHADLEQVVTSVSQLVPADIASIEGEYLWELFQVLQMDVSRINQRLDKSIQASLRRQECMRAELRQLEIRFHDKKGTEKSLYAAVDLSDLKLRLRDQMRMLKSAKGSIQ